MVTLIIGHQNSKRSGQCDARCYNSKTPNCKCSLCGGKNHGVGLQMAIENTREMRDELVKIAQDRGNTIQIKLPEAPKKLRDSKGRFIKRGSN